MNKTLFSTLILLFATLATGTTRADEGDDKMVVKPAHTKVWNTFPLSNVRLLPGSPFYRAMQVDQRYILGMDVDRMLNEYRRKAGLPEKGPYPSSNQPEGTRPGYLDHYLSAVSLMYAQTGDKAFKERADYIIATLHDCRAALTEREGPGYGFLSSWHKLLRGELELKAPDELGYPWGGMDGNRFYSIHKQLSAYRDALYYTDNPTALELWVAESNTIADFVLKANPDLFDGMLDIEHGGMNDVFADLYAITGEKRYMDVSLKFNHQKVILNVANNHDVLYGRHANMQVPTFVGTAKQYLLIGNEVSGKATTNFLDMIYNDHMTAIGGISRYERFGRPGEISKRLGYTSNETCNTYNMLKVALQHFETHGDLRDMDYYERALYNHILASQDPESGGVTYYTSMASGGFKSFSNGYDLEGVWCCVGTGMENHAKYGEAIYFHNHRDLFVNLFIPSVLEWADKGLKLRLETDFPTTDRVRLTMMENRAFDQQLYFRVPAWAEQGIRVRVNGKPRQTAPSDDQYVRVSGDWKAGDVIELEIPQRVWLESTKDDPNLTAIFYGPVLLAGELGADRMPGSDLVRHAHRTYNQWIAPVDDIPALTVNKRYTDSWLKRPSDSELKFELAEVGISLIPYYQMRHQRYNVYWKMYSTDDAAYREAVVSDEINTSILADEQAHNLRGEGHDTTRFNDYRNFWENNRIGRIAEDGGWFAYDLAVKPASGPQFLVVTYWGGAPEKTAFDVIVDGQVIKHEDITEKYPLTYYEQVYELPQELVANKEKLTVTFRAAEKSRAGGVYALKLTADPKGFPGYSFY